jgi:hypothetical protein
MTLRVADDMLWARIVHQIVGPVEYLQLRHVPSD